MLTKREKRIRAKMRVRKSISGTSLRPRLSIFRSNKEIYAQIIDDVSRSTLVSASSREKDFSNLRDTKTVIASKVGLALGDRAKSKGIDKIVFDRNGYVYDGRVKSFAEALRQAGLKF